MSDLGPKADIATRQRNVGFAPSKADIHLRDRPLRTSQSGKFPEKRTMVRVPKSDPWVGLPDGTHVSHLPDRKIPKSENAKLKNRIGSEASSRLARWKAAQSDHGRSHVRFPKVAATRAHLKTATLCAGRKRSPELFQKNNFGLYRRCCRENIITCQSSNVPVWQVPAHVNGSIPSPPRPPGLVMRAYQTTGHLPVAVAHAWALIRPTTGVGTSANAICGLILTSRGCHCFRRRVEEHSGAYEGDREEKVPCHGETSCERRAGHSKS